LKTAVIADIHGNLPALNAVLADARGHGVERYVLAGDYVIDLPWSNEVTEIIRDLENCTAVQGNKEGYLRDYRAEDQSGWIYEQFNSIYQAVRDLSPENTDYLLSLPKSAIAVLPSGKKIFVTHWVPGFRTGGKLAAHSAQFYRKMMQNKVIDRNVFLNHVHDFLQQGYVIDALSGIDTDIVVFGHTHLQWHGMCNGKLVLNPGSCGLPLDGDNRAAYTVLDGDQIDERRVPYDIEAVISEAKRSEMYKQGMVWVDLCFAAMRSGYDTFSTFFERCEKLANERGESGIPYSNEVWNDAYTISNR
jgi:predicted phosphodiesterase